MSERNSLSFQSVVRFFHAGQTHSAVRNEHTNSEDLVAFLTRLLFFFLPGSRQRTPAMCLYTVPSSTAVL